MLKHLQDYADEQFHCRVYHGDVDLLLLHERDSQRYPVLLQSLGGQPNHVFDILFAYPREVIQSRAGDTDFLQRLNDRCAWHEKTPPYDLPFVGGWFLYLGYELAGSIEPVLRLPPSPEPCAYAMRVPCAVLFHRHQKEIYLVAETGFTDNLEAMRQDLQSLAGATGRECHGTVRRGSLYEEPAQRYLEAVAAIKAYIVAGDVFQVNLSRLWRAATRLDMTPAQLYRRLRAVNPAPMAAIASLPGMTLVSSSPERLVRNRGAIVDTRPIAGTRPRGSSTALDRALARDLMLNTKEIAEHIMLIDLERNDLGRVCEPGSVHVDEMMVRETFAHVHHIVSNISGRRRRQIEPADLIRALFPGGTITGCPKIRCMEIISELERQGRGAYTGSLGYVSAGNMDLNILIRTMEVRPGEIQFRAGAGIVHDSQPDAELAETRAKAKGMINAL